jgi:hypothetical protein
MEHINESSKASIRWLSGRWHVGESDAWVIAEMAKRLDRKSNAAKHKEHPHLRQEFIDYALECHHANQAQYRWVMRGRNWGNRA